MSTSPAQRATFRDVFSVSEFRALWTSYVLSGLGDRLALVALTLLVYARTRSPLLAAVAYAAGTLPYLAGALFLSGLADRFPRREVMVVCDVIRAVLVTAMLVPGVPLDALIVLLYAVTAFQAPFDTARAAIVRDVVQGERYAMAAATLQSTFRVVVVAGAAIGGLTVAVLGARLALGVDVASFVASALIIRFGVRARPAAAAGSSPNALLQLGRGVRVVFGDRALRTLVLLGWLVVFYTIPQAIAAPYAARLGGGPVATGLVLASTTLATAIGTPLFSRLVRPPRRLSLMGPLAVATCAILVLTALHPGLAVSLVIFSASAAFGAYQIAVNTAFVVRVPDERRAQAFGIAGMGVIVGQGAGFVAVGTAAEMVTPAVVIAVAGGIGTVAAFALTLSWRRVAPSTAGHEAGRRPARMLARPAVYRPFQPG